jgi:lauroyl/myristoyl acyltransferase
MSLETCQQPVSALKRLRYRFEYLGLKFVEAFIPRLPYAVIQPLANALGFLVYQLDTRSRTVAIENLRVAFGDAYDPHARARIARKSFQNFARTMLCLFWSPNLNPQNYQQYIRIEGLDNHPIHRDKTAPGVYFLTHFSNFEWISLASSFAVTPGLVITQTFKNPMLGPIFDNLRARGGHTIIPPSRALIRMIKLLRAGGKVGAAADLSINPKHGAVPIRCFGLWTSGSPITGILSERGGAALVPSQIFPNPMGVSVSSYHPPIQLPQDATHQQIAQACWDIMEPMIARNPELLALDLQTMAIQALHRTRGQISLLRQHLKTLRRAPAKRGNISMNESDASKFVARAQFFHGFDILNW